MTLFQVTSQHRELTVEEWDIVVAIRPELSTLAEIVRAGKQSEITPSQRVQLRLSQAILLERYGLFTEGIKCAEQVVALGQEEGWQDLVASAYAVLASFYYDLGNYAQAQVNARAALARDPQSVSGVIAWNALGLCAAESAAMDIETAVDNFHHAADLSRTTDYPLGYAMSLNWLGVNVHRVRGELDLMLARCDEAARILAKLKFPFNGHYYARAYYFWLKGDRDQLKFVLEQMRDIAPRSTFAAGSLAYYSTLLALDEENYPRAAQSLTELRDLASTTGHLEFACWARLAASRYDLLTGNLQSAVSWARDAIRTARRKESRYYELPCQVACARAALEMNEGVLCRTHLDISQQIAERLGCELELAAINLLRAVLDARERSSKANSSWLEAARRIKIGGYGFILERERALAFPLVAAYTRSRDPAVRSSAESMLEHLAKIAPLPLRILGLGRFEVWQGTEENPRP